MTLRDGRGLLCGMIAVLVLGQRLALPVGGSGEVPLIVLLLLLLAGFGVLGGVLEVDGRLATLLGATMAVTAALTCLAFLRGLTPSLLSLLLLIAIWVPAIALAQPGAAAVARGFFVDLMVLVAAVGLVLFLLQFAGIEHRDYLVDLLPPGLLTDAYNTGDPITWDSDIVRSNGVVFLEPSFYSLFLAVAMLVSLAEGRRRWALPVLGAAMLSAVSGNGLVVLGLGLLWMLVATPYPRRVLPVAPAVLVAGALAVLTPVGEVLTNRAGELGAEGSSASLRMVDPYVLFIPSFLRSGMSLLLGHGAGSAQDYILDQVGAQAVLSPAPVKALYEFGVVGAVVVLAFLLRLFLARGVALPWFPGLFVAFFVVNAGLQQPALAALCYLFVSMLAAPSPDPGPPAPSHGVAAPPRPHEALPHAR